MKMQTNDAKTVALSDVALFFAVGWIFVTLLSSPFFMVRWFTPGDFSYSSAMYYHGIMVPLLILLYLLTTKMLPLKVVDKRLYTAGAMLSILIVGIGSIFNTSKGLSAAAVVQIIGMVMTDCLGIALLSAMAIFALGKNKKSENTGTAFWLLFTSIAAILIAAPMGHLAGWCIDIGARSLPGFNTLHNATGIKPDDFQDGLVGSHSHLIVAALMSGLSAIAAIYFQYQSRVDWRKRISSLGLWITLVSLLSATGIYVFSATAGWEPPALFASGPNGIPLDDVVLTMLEIGFLILIIGLSGSFTNAGSKGFSPITANLRISIFLNWICGFMATVLPGIYIEFNEGFYGAGVSPAPGALNDNIFIRAHLLYPFLLLPVIFVVTLAVSCRYNHTMKLRTWPKLFARASIFGMVLGLAGEILWFTMKQKYILIAAIFILGIALIAGMISLWPGTDVKESYHEV